MAVNTEKLKGLGKMWGEEQELTFAYSEERGKAVQVFETNKIDYLHAFTYFVWDLEILLKVLETPESAFNKALEFCENFKDPKFQKNLEDECMKHKVPYSSKMIVLLSEKVKEVKSLEGVLKKIFNLSNETIENVETKKDLYMCFDKIESLVPVILKEWNNKTIYSYDKNSVNSGDLIEIKKTLPSTRKKLKDITEPLLIDFKNTLGILDNMNLFFIQNQKSIYDTIVVGSADIYVGEINYYDTAPYRYTSIKQSPFFKILHTKGEDVFKKFNSGIIINNFKLFGVTPKEDLSLEQEFNLIEETNNWLSDGAIEYSSQEYKMDLKFYKENPEELKKKVEELSPLMRKVLIVESYDNPANVLNGLNFINERFKGLKEDMKKTPKKTINKI